MASGYYNDGEGEFLRRNRDFTEDEFRQLKDIRNKIISCMRPGMAELFATAQSFPEGYVDKTTTPKMHKSINLLMNHLVDAIKKYGGMEYLTHRGMVGGKSRTRRNTKSKAKSRRRR
jgi:hypothetical protein